MTIPERISALRHAMEQHGIDAYLVGSADPHQSEYVATHWQSRQWLSGFDGSAGTLVVTQREARLWTDSRYFIQAETQLAGTGIELMKLNVPHTPEHLGWLADHLKPGQTLGYDGQVVSVKAAERIEKKLADIGVTINPDHDLLSDVWTDRPPLPATSPFEHPRDFLVQYRETKLKKMRDFLGDEGLDYYLVIGLDEIAWLLNVRANDVDFNPLCLSYLLVNRNGATWFVGSERIGTDMAEAMAAENIALAEYDDLLPELYRIGASNQPIGMDPNLASLAVYRAAGGPTIIQIDSPIAAWKAIKGPEGLAHIRTAMARDGLALLRLRRWLTQEGIAKGVDEATIADRLAAFRAEGDHYFGESFPAIVGYRGNGAIVHYRAHHGDCAKIEAEGLLLLDSGGQYFDGTTDITRTFALGSPSVEERLHFTLVLQGHIDLAMARFPVGTTGVQLDVLARLPLWQNQLNYGHGTGHGVGYFLNVHEGPMSISPNPRAAGPKVPLRPGMVISNEPGYYAAGQHGIRVENLVAVRKEKDGWLSFETLTVFPIERQLIQKELLSPRQRQWLNDYHAQVETALENLVETPEEREWLADACAPI